MDKKHKSTGNKWVERYTQSALSDMSSEDLQKLLDESNLSEELKEQILVVLNGRDPSKEKTITVADKWGERYTQSVLSEMLSDDLQKLLEESNLSDEVKEQVLAELNGRDPSKEKAIVDTNKEMTKYNSLLSIAELLKFIAILVVIGGLIVGFLAFENDENGIAIGIGVILTSIVSAVFFFAVAELIKVFVNISAGVDKLVGRNGSQAS